MKTVENRYVIVLSSGKELYATILNYGKLADELNNKVDYEFVTFENNTIIIRVGEIVAIYPFKV